MTNLCRITRAGRGCAAMAASGLIASLMFFPIVAKDAVAKSDGTRISKGHSKKGHSKHGKMGHSKHGKAHMYRHKRPKIGVRRHSYGHQGYRVKRHRSASYGHHGTTQHKKIRNREVRRHKRVIGHRVYQHHYTSYRGARYGSHIVRGSAIAHSNRIYRKSPGWSSKRFHARIGIRVKNKPWRGRFRAGSTYRSSGWMRSRY